MTAAAASSPAEQELLREEMRALSGIGNRFRIRHHETDTASIGRAGSAYLFARMDALLHRLHPHVRRII